MLFLAVETSILRRQKIKGFRDKMIFVRTKYEDSLDLFKVRVKTILISIF